MTGFTPRLRCLTIIIAILLIACSAGTLFAEEETGWVKPGLFLDTNVAAGFNYLGLRLTNDIFYRVPLVKNPGMLWRSTKIDFGISDELTPSFHRISALLRIEPIALFDVKVVAGYDIQWAALTGGIYNAQDPLTITDWGSGFEDVYAPEPRQTGHGFRLKVMPTVKAALGPVAALYTFTLGYHAYNVDTETGFYYDVETATLQRIDDLYFVHDAKLLVQFYDFRAGANFVATDLSSWDYTSMKLTGLLVYTPTWKFLPKDLHPYAVLQMGSFLVDQYNVGKFSFAAVVGFNTRLF